MIVDICLLPEEEINTKKDFCNALYVPFDLLTWPIKPKSNFFIMFIFIFINVHDDSLKWERKHLVNYNQECTITRDKSKLSRQCREITSSLNWCLHLSNMQLYLNTKNDDFHIQAYLRMEVKTIYCCLIIKHSLTNMEKRA